MFSLLFSITSNISGGGLHRFRRISGLRIGLLFRRVRRGQVVDLGLDLILLGVRHIRRRRNVLVIVMNREGCVLFVGRLYGRLVSLSRDRLVINNFDDKTT